MNETELLSFFPKINPTQLVQFSKFIKLFADWNERINLVSRKDIDCFFTHHLLHSLSLAKVIHFTSQMHIVDIGTGGGLPGLPLAILYPETRFFLVDSISKKAHAVTQMVEELDLKNVLVLNQRAETLTRKFDIIVCRAVAPMSQLYHNLNHLLKPPTKNRTDIKRGFYCLKGGCLDEELKGFKTARIIDIKTWFPQPFFETKKIVIVLS